MVCAPVRSIIPSLKLGDYLSVQAHKHVKIIMINMNSNPLTPASITLCLNGLRLSILSLSYFPISAKASP